MRPPRKRWSRALIGGFLDGFFIHASVGFVGSIIIAFNGALILLAIPRAFGGGRARA